MRLIDKQLLRELIGPFVFGVMAFSSVFFAGTYLLKLTNLLMNGLSLLTAIEISLLYLPSIIVYTLPMSTLLAVLIGMGRLSGDSEVVALFASGVSLYRLAAPIFILGLVISGCAIGLNEFIAPRAYDHNERLMADIMNTVKPTDQPFIVRDEGTDSVIEVRGGMDTSSGILKDVTITKFMDNKPSIVLYAARAQWEGIRDKNKKFRWRLYDGWSQLIGTDSPSFTSFGQTSTREEEIRKTPEHFALYQKSFHKSDERMSFNEMTQLVKYLKENPDRPINEIRELDVGRWNKVALPLSSLIFAMLATPMGIRPQRSTSSVGFGLSILLIFLYWMVWHYTSSLAIEGSLSPIAGAFAADVLGLMGAFVLLKRAAK